MLCVQGSSPDFCFARAALLIILTAPSITADGGKKSDTFSRNEDLWCTADTFLQSPSRPSLVRLHRSALPRKTASVIYQRVLSVQQETLPRDSLQIDILDQMLAN
jgi:hypothetical protein